MRAPEIQSRAVAFRTSAGLPERAFAGDPGRVRAADEGACRVRFFFCATRGDPTRRAVSGRRPGDGAATGCRPRATAPSRPPGSSSA